MKLPGAAFALSATILSTGAAAAEPACGVSLAASHVSDAGERSTQQLRIDLANSQYRVGDAPWRSTSALCDADHVDLVAGETAAVACREDAVCGDYSFLFRVEVISATGEVVESRLIPFPTQTDAIAVRRARSVNLGDLKVLLEEQAPQTNPRRVAREL